MHQAAGRNTSQPAVTAHLRTFSLVHTVRATRLMVQCGRRSKFLMLDIRQLTKLLLVARFTVTHRLAVGTILSEFHLLAVECIIIHL